MEEEYIYIYTYTYARHAFNHQGQRGWKIQVVGGGRREGIPLPPSRGIKTSAGPNPIRSAYDNRGNRLDPPSLVSPFDTKGIPKGSVEQPRGNVGRGGKIFPSTSSWQGGKKRNSWTYLSLFISIHRSCKFETRGWIIYVVKLNMFVNKGRDFINFWQSCIGKRESRVWKSLGFLRNM